MCDSLTFDKGRDAARRDHKALKKVERYTGDRSDGRLDRICVRERDEGLAEVSLSKAVQRGRDPVLHRREGLTVWELEGAGQPLNGAPLRKPPEVLELGSCPLAEVALDEPGLHLNGQAEKLGKRLCSLDGPLER